MTPAHQETTAAFMEASGHRSTIFGYSGAYLELLDRIEDGEFDDEDTADLQALVAGLQGARDQKLENIVGLAVELEYRAAGGRAEASRIIERAAARERRSERLRDLVKNVMDMQGLKRLETSRFTLSILQNPPHVEILDAGQVPREFERTTITTNIDKKAILANFKVTGEIPDGVSIVRRERLDVS